MIIQEGQNIFDVTTQKFGTLENLFDFLSDNDLFLNTKLKSGQEILINNSNKGDENVKSFVSLNALIFNNNQGRSLPPVFGGDYNNDYNSYYN